MKRTGEQLERLMLEVEQFVNETGDDRARQVALAVWEIVGAMSSIADMSDAFTPGYARQLQRFIAHQSKLSELVASGALTKPVRMPSSTETDG